MSAVAAQTRDVIVIGGGQAGLAVGYYLRRTNLTFAILDGEPAPGGAWRHAWASLRLFSPAQWSSLPGWPMPEAVGAGAVGAGAYPSRSEVIDYLARYEACWELPVVRPVEVHAVRAEEEGEREGEGLVVDSSRGAWRARAVVSATGTWRAPYWPSCPGQARFRGRQLHSAQYQGPEPFAGQRVLVVGGGNSGAQVLAEVSLVADTTWVTLQPPNFLPDEVDGRELFERATARWKASLGRPSNGPPHSGLSDVVMVEPVKAARARGALHAVRPFERFTETGVVWPDGRETAVDAVIWCTGFRPALQHLRSLGVVNARGLVDVAGTRSILQPRLWLVGYGGWTGFASATLTGVRRGARHTAREIDQVVSVAEVGARSGERRF